MAILAQKGKIKIMKNIKKNLVLTVVTLLTGILIVACSQDDGIAKDYSIESINLKTGLTNRTAAISCYISGSTVINANTDIASSTVNAGTTATFKYNSNPLVTNIQWVIVSGTGISFIGSTTSSSVKVSFSSTFTGGSIKAIGTDSSGQICGPVLPISTTNGGGGGKCTATIRQIYCSPGTGGYNAMINVDVNATNPFPNLSSVLVQWDPNYFSGYQNAGGLYNIVANSTALIPSQFSINASINSLGGYYVPIIVKYTDLTTGQTCTVNLNPLLTDCSGSPF